MTRKEAEEIIELYDKYKDVCCSCHISPPCFKCTDQPSYEEYVNALDVMLIVSEEE